MAKISELPKSAEVSGTEAIPIVQSGETKQASVEQIRGIVPNGIDCGNGELQLTANGAPVGDPAELPTVTVDSEMSDTSENPVQNKIIKQYVDSATPPQNSDYVRYSFMRDYLEQFNTDTAHAFSYNINASNMVIEFLINLAYATPANPNWTKILPVPEIPDIKIYSCDEHGVVDYDYDTEQICKPFMGLYIDVGAINGSGTEDIRYVSIDKFEMILSGGNYYDYLYGSPQMIYSDLNVHTEWWSNTSPNTSGYKQPYNGVGIAFNMSVCETQDDFTAMANMINSMVKGFVICWQKQPKTIKYENEVAK